MLNLILKIKFLKNILIRFYQTKAFNYLVIYKYEKALKYFKKIENISSNEKGLNLNIGISLLGLDRIDEAEKYFFKEISLYGENYYIYKSLAELYYISNQREKAVIYYKKALETGLDLNELAYLKKKLKIAENEEMYNNMLKGYKLFKKAVSLMESEEYEEALKVFFEAEKYDKANPFLYNNIATIYNNFYKDYDKAIEFYNKALKIYKHPIIFKNKDILIKYLIKNRKIKDKDIKKYKIS